MNSFLKVVFSCVSVVLLCINVQSRLIERTAFKRSESAFPGCATVVLFAKQLVKEADLNLTPEQQALFPKGEITSRSEDDECQEAMKEWVKKMTPFFKSLTKTQWKELNKSFYCIKDFEEDTQMLRRTIADRQKWYNDDNE